MSYSDKHYGEGAPDCPICKGVGYVRYDVPEGDPRFGKAFDCQCRNTDAVQGRQDRLRRLAGLDHLADKTLETFNAEGVGLTLGEAHRANLRRAYEQVQAYAANPQGWLVITGGYGCGKTHLAAGIANAQIAAGQKVIFTTVPDLLDHLRAGFGTSDEEETYDARFDEVRNAPLLILDDMGIESPTEWALEKLFQLMNYRYNAHLPTVITTNHSLEEMDFRLRSRLFDQDISQIVGITAPDYRYAGVASRQGGMGGLGLYGNMTFESFKLRSDLPKAQQDNLRKAVEAARKFANHPDGWLVLLGVNGSGKTHLAAAIANYCVAVGNPFVFVTVPDLLDHLRSTFAPKSTISYDKRFSEIKNTPLLILDDLWTESATDWARDKLYQLINYRYTARLPMVVTTAQELENLGDRIVARMRDKRLCHILTLTAPAYLGERETAQR